MSAVKVTEGILLNSEGDAITVYDRRVDPYLEPQHSGWIELPAEPSDWRHAFSMGLSKLMDGVVYTCLILDILMLTILLLTTVAVLFGSLTRYIDFN